MGMMGAGLSMIGGLVQGMGAMQAHEAAAAAHEYNAAVAERNRGVILEQTEQAIKDTQVLNRRLYSSIRATYAANGVTLTGSSFDVLMDTIHEKQLDISRIRYKGQLLALEQQDTQNLEEMGAAAEHQAGQLAMVAGILNGLTSAVNQMNSMSG